MDRETYSAATQADLPFSGGITGGALTILTLGLAITLVVVLVKKCKLRVSHVFAVIVMMFVFQFTPPGQLIFGAVTGGLNRLAAISV